MFYYISTDNRHARLQGRSRGRLATYDSFASNCHQNCEFLFRTFSPSFRLLTILRLQYELQGGSVNILVCDDGMQLLNKTDFATRKGFYEANAIAYVGKCLLCVTDCLCT